MGSSREGQPFAIAARYDCKATLPKLIQNNDVGGRTARNTHPTEGEEKMLVEQIMTKSVVGVKPSVSIGEAAKLMLAHNISGLPVVQDGALAGLVTEGDLLRRSEIGTERKRPHWLEFLAGAGRAADEYVHAHGRKVEEVMTTKVETVEKGTRVDQAVDLMMRRHVKRLPVVENGKVVGIVARSDIMRALANALPLDHPAVVEDRRIESSVMEEFSKQPWAGLIRVRVYDGALELSGPIMDERVRTAARVVAENTPGVRSISDHLVWIEPVSGMVILPAAA